MLTELTRGHEPGQWWPIILDEYGDSPVWRATIRSPECGKRMSLQRGHTIAADGQVTPSVGHPDAYGEAGKQCPWHTSPRLVGWDHLTDPQPRTVYACAKCKRESRSLGGWGNDGRYSGLVCDQCKKAEASSSDTESRTESRNG